jgi:hypothetical protein
VKYFLINYSPYRFIGVQRDIMATPSSTTVIEEFSNKELLERVRPLLQRDKIRLWEPPYTDANTGAENIPEV